MLRRATMLVLLCLGTQWAFAQQPTVRYPSPLASRTLCANPAAPGDTINVPDSVRACLSAAEVALVASHFERSYITSTGLGGGATSPHLIFEANVAPPFYVVAPGKRFAVVLTPKVVLRMFNTSSVPVRTPSYMPRITGYWFREPASAELRHGFVRYLWMTVSHHSNGQEGNTHNPDGTINFDSGNFSTNFWEIGQAQGGWWGGSKPHWSWESQYSFEQHFANDSESTVEYSKRRLHGGAAITYVVDSVGTGTCWRDLGKLQRLVRSCITQVTFGGNLTYLMGEVEPQFHGLGRWPIEAEIGVTPSFTPDLAFFVQGYWGQDYYNLYFHHYLGVVRVGVQATRGHL